MSLNNKSIFFELLWEVQYTTHLLLFIEQYTSDLCAWHESLYVSHRQCTTPENFNPDAPRVRAMEPAEIELTTSYSSKGLVTWCHIRSAPEDPTVNFKM